MATYRLKKVKDIREKYNDIFAERAEMTSANFSKYREKLIKNDILRAPANTYLEFALPRFDAYARIYGRVL